jgi:EAL domain-containing protein (putative c-di-GMP-specific phosphodiesterase class I)
VAIFPEHGADAATLIQKADVAMYAAKRSGTRIRFYEPSDDFSSVRQLSLRSDLHQAVESNEFELHYQPKVAAAGGLLGVEALLRWNHPKLGRLAPGEFIGMAEHTGLIRGITGWALNEAIRQAAAWENAGLTLPVAVNLSARNLLQRDLPSSVDWLLKKYHLPPDRCVLEITESMIVEDPKLASEVVGRLRSLGVRISIDDFGTGYSSLSYLQHFPASELKIDRSFVTGVEENPGDRAIVRSTIELAHNLGLSCIAEGVETESAWELIKTLGCDGAQGYLFAKPLPAKALEEWVAESQWARKSPGTDAELYRPEVGEADELRNEVAEGREILAPK